MLFLNPNDCDCEITNLPRSNHHSNAFVGYGKPSPNLQTHTPMFPSPFVGWSIIMFPKVWCLEVYMPVAPQPGPVQPVPVFAPHAPPQRSPAAPRMGLFQDHRPQEPSAVLGWWCWYSMICQIKRSHGYRFYRFCMIKGKNQHIGI